MSLQPQWTRVLAGCWVCHPGPWCCIPRHFGSLLHVDEHSLPGESFSLDLASSHIQVLCILKLTLQLSSFSLWCERASLPPWLVPTRVKASSPHFSPDILPNFCIYLKGYLVLWRQHQSLLLLGMSYTNPGLLEASKLGKERLRTQV